MGDDNQHKVLFEAYYEEKLMIIMKDAIYTNAQLNGFNSEDVPHTRGFKLSSTLIKYFHYPNIIFYYFKTNLVIIIFDIKFN